MAARSRLQVGSGPWIAEERSSAAQIAESEIEEFSFSLQNDFDWLNEHMDIVMNSENPIDVTEIFKTPGRFRGKTPRTVRKGITGENRVPLSNIFSSTPQGGPGLFAKPAHARHDSPQLKVAADPLPSPSKAAKSSSPLKRLASPIVVGPTKALAMADSGYHGSQPVDAMEIDDSAALDESIQPSSPQANAHSENVSAPESPILDSTKTLSQQISVLPLETEEDEFDTPNDPVTEELASTPTKENAENESTTPTGSPIQSLSHGKEIATPANDHDESSHTPTGEPPMEEPDMEETPLEEGSPSPSDGSSPIRPIVRKSSLNFASLPAREPMTHKSIGNRISRTSHLDQTRQSYYRHTGGKSLGPAKQEDADDAEDEEHDNMDIDDFPDSSKPDSPAETDTATTHSKTYTQRLQDQISQLGKIQDHVSQLGKATANAQRASKQMMDPTATVVSLAPPSPVRKLIASSPLKLAMTPGAFPLDDDDDWIEPLGTPDDASKSPHPGMRKSNAADEGVFSKETTSGQDITAASAQAEDPSEGKDLQKATTSLKAPAVALPPNKSVPATPKSPTRVVHNSPLKQVKNTLSSIFKGSRGLLSSSAAVSADAKASILPASNARLGRNLGATAEPLATPVVEESQPLYPDLSREVADMQTPVTAPSPKKPEGRRTRASVERAKAEEKRRKEEEAKEAAERAEKLEVERIFNEEQERMAAMEKQAIAQQEQEKRAAFATPAPASKTVSTSPRKANVTEAPDTVAPKTAQKLSDIEMSDAPDMVPPPTVSRPAPASAMKGKDVKRPIKPTKEPAGKAKQAPTVIRVNLGVPTAQDPQRAKAGPSSAAPPTKPSLPNFNRSTSTRPKALEAAARRKEQEEREQQRRREAKAELERRRAANQEEEKRLEEQRKLEAERKREEERKQAEAKKNAQRQAMLEKAKQTRAPPPAARNQAGGPPDYGRTEAGPARPPSRLGMATRGLDDASRPVNAVLSTGVKSQLKRALPQETGDDGTPRGAQTRAAFQPKDAKRMRMTDELNEPSAHERQPKPSLKGAPVRPSGGLKKDMTSKSIFSSGYTNAPPQGVTRDLFKATLTSQHTTQHKAAHPLDMTQVSKSAIPFASNAGPSKTPARAPGLAGVKSAAKSATRSSPRFQNGDSVELPEINTDDDDEDDDDDDDGANKKKLAEWTNTPNLQRALAEQQNKNPFEVFGAPPPLDMEEVFARSKDRFPRFRARTSSANWSGADGLSEEDIRKDLAAREQMRREGGWNYDMGRDMV